MPCSMRSACCTSTCRSPRRRSGVRCMAAERQRPLVAALMASLVLHALVLSLRPPALKPASPYSAPLVTRLARTEPLNPIMPPIAKRAPLPTPKPRSSPPTGQASQLPVSAPSAAEPPPAVADAGMVARYRYEVIATALRYQRAAGQFPETAEGEVALS